MKIAIATPLYPPDIAAPAPYVKELATRLSTIHEVVIITYGYLPEKIPGVTIHATSKQQPLLMRLSRYRELLNESGKDADVLILENGPSTELPFLLSKKQRVKVIFHRGDPKAHHRTKKNPLYALLERLTTARCSHLCTDLPETRPEILPFTPYPTEAFAAYEVSWKKHLSIMEKLF